MKRRKLTESLYGIMLVMSILPMAILGIVTALFCMREFTHTIYSEVETELEDICELTLSAYDELYPGDFHMEGEEQKVFYKGETPLNGDYHIIDRVKKDTDIDVTIFYYDTRILTTITDEAGNRIVGTGSNAIVMQDVYEKQQPKFYESVQINGEDYFCYYAPLIDSAGESVGMIFAGKPSHILGEATRQATTPTLLVILIFVIVFGSSCFFWTQNTIRHLQVIEKYLTAMANGSFTKEMDLAVIRRKDEIGKMGSALVKMQASVRDFVEKDPLTGLNNRRFGIRMLDDTKKKAEINGVPFAVALGDIDFFKRFNDSYGHDCGDLVLVQVSNVMRKNMLGKGYAIRWGGEEFLLVFTHDEAEAAGNYVEDLLEEVRNMEICYNDQTLHITMTFGVAEGDFAREIDEMIKEADEKLYYGKENGRNQLVRAVVKDMEGEEADEMEEASV